MKSKILFIIIFSFLALAAAVLFLGKNSILNPAPVGSPTPSQIEPTVLPPAFNDFEIQIKKTDTGISLSWDDVHVSVFHTIVLDTEDRIKGNGDPVIWFMASEAALTKQAERNEISAFLSSPYTIGERKESFGAHSNEKGFDKGREYYAQVSGFDVKGNRLVSSRTFRF